MFRLKGLFMEISNNTNSILNSNLNTNSSLSEEQKDRFDIFLENQEKDKAEKKERSELLGDLEFVSKTGFTKDYEAAPREAKEQYKKIVDGYSIFSQVYNKL